MKLFITTSGTGSRLLDLTKYTNKAMIKIGKRPVISYIIDSYPKDFDLVVTLGYYGDHVKQYLSLAYPDRNIEYVTIDKYEGEGTSQVYSQLQAEQYLQEPFIYNDCDTIIENLQEQIPMNFDYDFMVGYESNSELYDSFDYEETTSRIIKTYAKPNSLVGMLSYVGIIGIHDYKNFWKAMHKAYEEVDYKHLNDFTIFDMYYKSNQNFKAVKVDNWTDTGNISGVKIARKKCSDKFFILDKNDQGIFIIGNKVIKFFAKDGVVKNLIKHYEKIKDFCQPITEYTNNFLCYDYIEADNAIDGMNPVRFKDMLYTLYNNGLWSDPECTGDYDYIGAKHEFYITKTLERFNKFKEFYNINEDKDIRINDVLIPKEYTIEYMLNEMEKLSYYKNDYKLTNWHGDFVLDNMLYDKNNDRYILLDWREKFPGCAEYGDYIYDFAKMNHNLTFNFSSACNDLFKIDESDPNCIYVSILCDNYVYECRKVLKRFVENEFNLSYSYINLLTGLCWINMTPLYFLNPLCKMLYYMGKLTMYQALQECKYHDKLISLNVCKSPSKYDCECSK